MSGAVTSIRFVIGSRQVYAARRRLVTVSLSLEQLLSGSVPPVPPLPKDCDGYRFLSVPADAHKALVQSAPGFLPGGQQDYARRYIAMDGTFADYLGSFSGKTRSTLKRKQRKLADLSGGTLDIEAFARPDDMDRFFAGAVPLSRQTYQARLLGAGLPEDPAFISAAKALAREDRLRAYLLRVDGAVAAYLYLPIDGDTLVYAYLGYAPHMAAASVGTVLQLAALEQLFAEGRFRYFDFTEGDGAHKELFSTGAAHACSFYLLRPTAANRALLASLAGFDATISGAKALTARLGLGAALRRMLRR
ncbi:GNAT family N-acetyltransferase [Novosphingobium sp.]|uniref:GNAT family N-acetyltransferase n=1 Tax=Novosphingobium sp. TaxID=1874826 RepID=UPI0025DC0D2E|nr:GNAT family N-acetyltransferase [Novosphingobium sp.]